MLFKSKKPKSFFKRVAEFFWPKGGFQRSASYVWHRVARMPGSIHAIAAGFASGAAVSFTPFLGLHFLMGFVLAYILRGNLIASAIGTGIGNPWTFPFIFALTGWLGSRLLGVDDAGELPVAPEYVGPSLFSAPLEFFPAVYDYLAKVVPAWAATILDVAWPYIIGAIPVSVIVWIVFYLSLTYAISSYRSRRDLRREQRAKLVQETVLNRFETHALGEDVTIVQKQEDQK